MRILLWPIRFIQLVLYFLWDLFSSSVIVAWDVLTPRDRSEPQLLLMPLDAETDAEIMATANLISLTPGTLSLDVTPDRKHLLVHSMFGAGNPDEVRKSLKGGIERRLLRVTR
ncbi:Na+/H+ antiporter subunit E [Pontivivens insulae]|uniref:Na(+)/H(+) antiporter subunit E1 n=1 Tax=Pontivivens insulae TaxID=1639689 RepID=A0A2R8A6A3_9RHOB|nr:Na+/H+ antiporter subunit E [Pontivivens insulae]RED17836.1 multicomponent Na+:H+ antiporter subunit E [Pontivivens insulae]SPF27726.1 Na(+)/H(+) antiporter subunit E1 [Pontivivens insulae]